MIYNSSISHVLPQLISKDTLISSEAQQAFLFHILEYSPQYFTPEVQGTPRNKEEGVIT